MPPIREQPRKGPSWIGLRTSSGFQPLTIITKLSILDVETALDLPLAWKITQSYIEW